MKYAVLDWDNTLRNGITLFDWCEFLVKNQILDPSVLIHLRKLESDYLFGTINHDELAEKSCSFFAKSLKGKSVKELDQLENDFLIEFEQRIFSFSKYIASFLIKNNCEIIFVSGAIKTILQKYFKKKNIRIFDLHAFECEQINGLYTGNVLTNFGVNKQQILRQLIHHYGKPTYAIGDSSSDEFAFSNSQKSILVRINSTFSYPANLIIEKSDKDCDVIKKLSKL